MTLKENPRSEMGFSDCPANQQSEDVEVDITECGNNQRDEFQEEEVLCQSSSSSFGDSMCARDDDDDDDSGFEAQSMLSKDYPLPETCGGGGDGADFLGLRKKKLTDDWRKFCQPLMWRCKWLELKVKEIESQAKGYEREVRNYYGNKQFDLEKAKFEGLDGKSIPFRDQTQRMSVFKRGRRKRVEDTTDVAAYMPNHNVFSYADKRKPTTLRAQCPDPDFGTGRKATGKEDETEEDCLVSELDCGDDYLAKILCKIDEAQEKAKTLRKRIGQLIPESQTALAVPSMPESQTAHTPLVPPPTIQVGKQDDALVEEPLMVAQATVQIGRQRISADHTEDVVTMMPQDPSFQIDGQCFNNISPLPGCLRSHPLLEDLFMDEPEMEGDETEMGKEKLDLFKKLMDSLADPSEEADEDEEDPTPVTKRHKASN